MAAVTNQVEPVEVNKAETELAVMVNLLAEANLLVVQEDQVFLVLNSLVVTVTLEDNRTLLL